MRSRGLKPYRVVMLGAGVCVVAGLIPAASAAAVAAPPHVAASAVSAGITDCVRGQNYIWTPSATQTPRVSVVWKGLTGPIAPIVGERNKAVITVSAAGRKTAWRGFLALNPGPYGDGISTSISQSSLSGVWVRRGGKTSKVPRGCWLDATGAKYARYAWPVKVKPGQTVTYTLIYTMNRMPPQQTWQFDVISMPSISARPTRWADTQVFWTEILDGR